MLNIVHIVGNRPQFIKLWVLYFELKKNPHIRQTIIHSGQHYSKELNDIFFTQLELPLPDYQLNIQNSRSADIFIGACSQQIYEIFNSNKKSIALVYGDTNTTLAAALAAKRTKTPLHHFEAGVRTKDSSMPEEINRILTDRLADVNYCCTQKNYTQLIEEGYSTSIPSNIFLTGDLMYDAFMKAQKMHIAKNKVEPYIAATIHRVDNILNKTHLSNIIEALNVIHKEVPVKMPLHPHTKKKFEEFGLVPNFDITAPMDYFSMHHFTKNAQAVVTDSGGVSREAFFAQKPSLIIMSDPFWSEIMDAGCAIQSLASKDSILESYRNINQLQPNFNQPIFGKGDAAQKIHQIISSYI